MAYKTVFVIVTDKAADERALIAAADVAVRENAHLDVHCLAIDPIRYDMMPIGTAGVLIDTGTSQQKELAKELVAWVEEKLEAYETPSTVFDSVVTTMGLDLTIARRAQYADLVVASKPYGDGGTQMQALLVEAVLFGTSAPALIVPNVDVDYTTHAKSPLIAWNESAEALEAVRKAIPLLQQAGKAELLMIDPPSHSPERSDPGGNISMMLSRHGVRANVSIVSKTMPRISDMLMRHATEHGNDLIVMGAYGHSRFREAILGGATREMLEESTLPVFMAH